MAQVKTTAVVASQEKIADDIYSMWIEAGEIAEKCVPGQFISVYTKDKSRLLPRPISICEADKASGKLRIVYRVVGGGTEEFSGYRAGDTIEIMGPLGNGFPLGEKSAFLIGGGIGIPPMLELAKALKAKGVSQITAVLGYRDQLFLNEEFQAYADVYVATEDGSVGTKGNVLDAIRANGLKADVIYACGPTPMLRALKAYAQENHMECWLSLEEKMACGIGACLACVCKSKEVDSHSHVHNKRICKDGPVFAAEEVEL
ncbi:MAG TPA: dihydroorotate dehydrogenase electron transfer subunit [Candidatus Lachnoclostridium stercoravium]|uniref:Dihydroorotate dehydrogenase B (NAD(+)), electron transfer subunit n=1 Tax=Candidatus Lachnoclostridium stercoravium TaxID=2838633 RepID=A0A9D2KPL1_9FIRM|nr:dihydroorotate dehydrogenase electron transfer subunit [Candidatus Lachnoclostridium stercoravium]